MLPADLDGSTLPPAGAPNSFVLFPDNYPPRIASITSTWISPSRPTPPLTFFGSSPAAGFTATHFLCVPELGSDVLNYLDNLADRLMFRLAYRNFGDHESLVGNFTVKVE